MTAAPEARGARAGPVPRAGSSSLVGMTSEVRRPGTAFATLAFLVLFGGDVLRNATGFVGWGLVVGIVAVVAAAVAWRGRARLRPFPRRLALLGVVVVA